MQNKKLSSLSWLTPVPPSALSSFVSILKPRLNQLLSQFFMSQRSTGQNLVTKSQKEQSSFVTSPWAWQPPCSPLNMFLKLLQPCFLHLLNKKMKVKVTQLCPTPCDPMDYTVHVILQARILQWVAFPFSRGIFPTQGLNPGLLHCRRILYQLSHQGSPRIVEWVAYPFSRGSSRPRDRSGVGLPHCRRILYQLNYQGSPNKNICSIYLSCCIGAKKVKNACFCKIVIHGIY